MLVSVVLVSNDNVPARITGRPSAYHNPAAHILIVFMKSASSVSCHYALNRSTKFLKMLGKRPSRKGLKVVLAVSLTDVTRLNFFEVARAAFFSKC